MASEHLRGQRGERRSLDQAHRQHAAARQLGVGAREDDVGLVGEVRREPVRVCGLALEVQLLERPRPEAGRQLTRLVATQLVRVILQQAREVGDQLEVDVDLLLDPVALHFHGDRGAVRELGSVDLRHRRRAERLVAERDVQLVHRPAELTLDRLTGGGSRLGLDLLLQLG